MGLTTGIWYSLIQRCLYTFIFQNIVYKCIKYCYLAAKMIEKIIESILRSYVAHCREKRQNQLYHS